MTKRKSTSTNNLHKPCPSCEASGQVLDERKYGPDLRRRREAAGLSLAALGELVGISAQYLCDIELMRRPLWHKGAKDLVKRLEGVLAK